jgi:hypothetical protein
MNKTSHGDPSFCDGGVQFPAATIYTYEEILSKKVDLSKDKVEMRYGKGF